MVSRQGRILALAIIGGLTIGSLTSGVMVYGVPLTLLLLQNNGLVQAGAYWQMFTSLFVAPPPTLYPLGLVDVLFNALAIVWLDGLFSSAYELKGYFVTFVFSGLVGNALSLLNGPYQTSFGASGGIFGLLAGAVSENFIAERRINYSLLVWFLIVFLFSSFTLPSVDWLAHLGGAVFGLVAGSYLGIKKRSAPL